MEVVVVEEEEEEIELTLGLSLGGRTFRKIQKQKPMFDSPALDLVDSDSRFFEAVDSPSCLCSSLSHEEILHREKVRSEILEQMRVQEEEKQRLMKKVKRRKGFDQQICKRVKVDDDGGVDGNPRGFGFGCSTFPTMGMQCVPNYGDGFGFSGGYGMMMPCWVPPASSAVADDGNVGQQQQLISLGPMRFPNAGSGGGVEVVNEGGCKKNGRKCGGGGGEAMGSSGSLGSSSSGAVSDYRSGGSQQGGSCETRSHSSQFPPPSELPRANASSMSNVQVQSELYNPTPVLKKPKERSIVDSNTAQSKPSKLEETSLPRTSSHPFNPSPTIDHASRQPLNRTNVDINKPPEPKATSRQVSCANEETNKESIPESCDEENSRIPKLTEPQAQPPKTQPLPHMPCVSTVGDGPDGKTISGFLYRYTKAEVSIICVCHGSSFTPAEFVKHAGGSDVLHPLKHIVVVPSPIA